jgi:glycosyltransferase involved in cell wall biosynthesis
MSKISVCILTKNDADNVEGAIESVRWADEIVVIDNGSSDRTPEIAKTLGVRVEQIATESFGEMRTRAAEAGTQEWIFSLDADERCPPALRDEILELLRSEPTHDAYRIPRRNYLMGRWIRGSGWYPNYRGLQLFRKGRMRYTPVITNEACEVLTDRGAGTLKNDLLHFPFRNFEELIEKTNTYSSLGARKLSARKVSMWTAFAHALGGALKRYVIQFGFRDGWAGFVIALAIFEETFYRYAKACERQEGWDPPLRW